MLVKINGIDKNVEEKIINKIEMVTKQFIKFFDILNIRIVKIHIYQNREEFLKAIQKWYVNKEIPKYCKGTIQNGEIYYYLMEDYKQNKNKLSLYICQIVHEYIHILYNEYIHKRQKNSMAR